MQITETRVNVTLGGGKAVHTGLRVVQDGVTYKATPECGGNKAGERYRETEAEVTCKKCLKLLAALAEAEAAYQARLEASMMPATEGHDLGYVAEDAEAAAAEQPAEIVETREAAREAAENARVEAALIRAELKLSAPAGVPAEQATLDAQRVRDAAHAEAVAYLDRVSIPDAEDLRRDLEAVVKCTNLCACGHAKHIYGPCYVGGDCGCTEYVPSGLEGVYDPRTDVWGVRRIGTTAATWLPWSQSNGAAQRHARAMLARRLAGGNA